MLQLQNHCKLNSLASQLDIIEVPSSDSRKESVYYLFKQDKQECHLLQRVGIYS